MCWLLKIQSEYVLNDSMSRVLRVGEAADRDAADAVDALGVLVLPGDVVAGAGRQHLDLVLRREALGDQAAEVLGAAEHLGCRIAGR